MEKLNKNFIIKQILPYYITTKIPTKMGICIVVDKKLTNKIITILKQKNLSLEKVYLKDNYFINKKLEDYKKIH